MHYLTKFINNYRLIKIMVKHINGVDEFEKEVVNHKGLVVIDFWAEWCGPCKMLEPIYEKLSKEMKDVKFCKVNVDENPEVAGDFGIMSIPTMIIFKDGQPVDQAIGALPEPMMREFLNRNREEEKK